MITDANIWCIISCPAPPSDYEAIFHLEYRASYEEDGSTKDDVFEKDFKVGKNQSRFVRFSDGSIVQFGHLPILHAWIGGIKRAVMGSHGAAYWGYHVCELMPTMGYTVDQTLVTSNSRLVYGGEQLSIEFGVPITSIHVSYGFFGRDEMCLVYQIGSPPAS